MSDRDHHTAETHEMSRIRWRILQACVCAKFSLILAACSDDARHVAPPPAATGQRGSTPEGLSDYAALRADAEAIVARASDAELAELTAPLPEFEVALDKGQAAPRRDYGAAYHDPASGKIGWRAFACRNSDCAEVRRNGGPFVFPLQIPGATVQIVEDGTVNITMPRGLEQGIGIFLHPPCPACGAKQWTQVYDPPEVAQRQRQLERQLAISRLAYQNAKAGGNPLPAAMRLPAQIMDDFLHLPKLYIFADDAESAGKRPPSP
jgi:hypothetical protein